MLSLQSSHFLCQLIDRFVQMKWFLLYSITDVRSHYVNAALCVDFIYGELSKAARTNDRLCTALPGTTTKTPINDFLAAQRLRAYKTGQVLLLYPA